MMAAFADAAFTASGAKARPSSRCEAEERMTSWVSLSLRGVRLRHDALRW